MVSVKRGSQQGRPSLSLLGTPYGCQHCAAKPHTCPSNLLVMLGQVETLHVLCVKIFLTVKSSTFAYSACNSQFLHSKQCLTGAHVHDLSYSHLLYAA